MQGVPDVMKVLLRTRTRQNLEFLHVCFQPSADKTHKSEPKHNIKTTTIGMICFCRGVRSVGNTNELGSLLRIHHETHGFRDVFQSYSALPQVKTLDFLHGFLVRGVPKPCFPAPTSQI